jgi:hypothetical protein
VTGENINPGFVRDKNKSRITIISGFCVNDMKGALEYYAR